MWRRGIPPIVVNKPPTKISFPSRASARTRPSGFGVHAATVSIGEHVGEVAAGHAVHRGEGGRPMCTSRP
jgi:hypothetical protein